MRRRDFSLSLSSLPLSQEEIESYDQYERKLEDALDAKTAQVIGLRKQLVQLRHQQQQRQETKPSPDRTNQMKE